MNGVIKYYLNDSQIWIVLLAALAGRLRSLDV